MSETKLYRPIIVARSCLKAPDNQGTKDNNNLILIWVTTPVWDSGSYCLCRVGSIWAFTVNNEEFLGMERLSRAIYYCNTKDSDCGKHDWWAQEVSESGNSSSDTTVRKEWVREISDEITHWWEGETEGRDGQRERGTAEGSPGYTGEQKRTLWWHQDLESGLGKWRSLEKEWCCLWIIWVTA